MKTICYATPQDHDLMRGFMYECSPTISAAAGHSGNNRPFFCKSTPFVKVGRARDASGDGEHWKREEVNPTINLFDMSNTRAVSLIVNIRHNVEGRTCMTSNIFTHHQRHKSVVANTPGATLCRW